MANRAERQSWMATLAKSQANHLQELVSKFSTIPEYTFLRPPEIGLVMVRGRTGGTGEPFNLGEITMTRCVVNLDSEEKLLGKTILGFSYIAGRALVHAELAAVCDALLQCPNWYNRVFSEVIQPLESAYHQRIEQKGHQTAATKVDFFTMLRGEG